jgi:hypothetical protein
MLIMNVRNAHRVTPHRLKKSKQKHSRLWCAEHTAPTVDTKTQSRWKSIPHPHRDTFLSKHHILAVSRKGTKKPSNILVIWYDKHCAWHKLFGLMTISEIINVIKSPKWFLFDSKRDAWEMLFGLKSKWEVVGLLRRTQRAKLAQKRV